MSTPIPKSKPKTLAPSSPSSDHQNNNKEEQTHPSPKRKFGHEIDEIFKDIKSKKKAKQKETKAEEKKNKKKFKRSATVAEDEETNSSDNNNKKKKWRKTADGMSIYSTDELGIGNPDAGGTPLCPFDCSCCF